MTHYHRILHADARREYVWLLLFGINITLWGRALITPFLIWIGAALIVTCGLGIWIHTKAIHQIDNPLKPKPNAQIQRRTTRQSPHDSPRSHPGRTVQHEVKPASQQRPV